MPLRLVIFPIGPLGRKIKNVYIPAEGVKVTLALPRLLHLGKAQIDLAFRSTFRNFRSGKFSIFVFF